MTTAYVYKWTELKTGKWYIGARGANGCHPNDGYICSSKVVKPLILSNPNEWTREILFTGEPSEIFYVEAQILESLNAKEDPLSFNKHNGDGKWSMRGKQFSDDHKKKMSAWQIGRKFDSSSITKRTASRSGFQQTEAAKKKIAESLKGHGLGIAKSEEQKEKIRKTLTGRKNGPLSEEHKALISSVKKGYKHKAESIEKMKLTHSGKVLTAEHKAKISSGGKGIKKSEETKARMRKPKVKRVCPFCGLLCAPHMFQRHIDARHAVE
jgi:NUMOD3 motif